jgi:tRNA A37 threonylcarbamoyladenosine dehydratase
MSKELHNALHKRAAEADTATYQPELFRLTATADAARLSELLKGGRVQRVVDDYADQEKELALVDDPASITHAALQPTGSVSDPERGVWVFYPWRGTLTHLLDEPEYSRLRLSRNKVLITEEEQAAFRSATVAFAGLNVGNPGALCMALEGGAKRMRFADNDPLSVSNLNRFRAGTADLGINKAVLSARQVYEIDPYAAITLLPEGVAPGQEAAFLTGPQQADVLVEETDNLKLKISIRHAARELGIPVVMVTGNDNDVVVDVERYDRDPDLALLNGHLTQEVQDGIAAIKPGEGTLEERIALARDFMGTGHLAQRLVAAFPEVGKSIVGIPQLATSSFLRGGAVSYVVRQIVTGGEMPSGRYAFRISDLMQHGA